MKNLQEIPIAKFTTWAARIVAVLAYIYIVLRGYFVPPFCDEITTFFNYIQSGDMQPFYANLDANNHVLNSAISRTFYLFFGGEIFVLRMANMLAFGGYIYYCFRFKAFFKNPLIWLAWFISMVSTQFFVDFFHLSRGYGLSMMFLLGVLFHLLQYGKHASAKDFLFGLALISLAVWSNLSILLSAICLTGTYLLLWIWRNRKKLSKSDHIIQLIGFLVLFVAPIFTAILYGFELQNAGQLYYGAVSNFWDNSILRTVQIITNNWQHAELFTAICISALIIISVWNLIEKKQSGHFTIHLVLWGSIIGIIVLHHVQHVNYPVDRAVIHLFLLFVTLLFLEMDLFQKNVGKWFGFVLAGSTLFGTIFNANLTHTELWDTVHLPKEFYNKIEDWKSENHRLPNVAVHGLHQNVLSYYNFLDGNNFHGSSQSEYPGSFSDFVILKDDVQWNASAQYDTVSYHPELKSGMMQIRIPPVWNIVDSIMFSGLDLTGEYVNLGKFNADHFVDDPVYITTIFSAQCPSELKDLQLIFTVQDSTEANLLYEKIDLHHSYPDLHTKKKFTANYIIEHVPLNAARISVFIWNVRNKPLIISNIETRFYTATQE